MTEKTTDPIDTRAFQKEFGELCLKYNVAFAAGCFGGIDGRLRGTFEVSAIGRPWLAKIVGIVVAKFENWAGLAKDEAEEHVMVSMPQSGKN